MSPIVHKFLIAFAIVAVLVAILIVFRLRNRGPKPEDSPEFRRQVVYASAGRGVIDAMSSAYPTQKPWSAFVAVKDHLRMRDQVVALEELRRIGNSSDAGTRVRLIAWNMLREMGQNPDAPAAQEIRGVVVEMPAGNASDVVAVYQDGSAARLDTSGKVADWLPSGSSAQLVMDQIEDAQKLYGSFTPTPELPPPANASPRITLLTFGGMRSKQVDTGAPDRVAMIALIDRARSIAAAISTSATSRSDQN